MKCPVCNEEMETLYEREADNNVVEEVGHCECGLYDGTWFIEKDEKGNVAKEYGLKRYWHG